MQELTEVHAAWLPPEAFRAIGSRRTLVHGTGLLVETVHDEAAQACARYGGQVRRAGGTGPFDLVLALSTPESPAPEAAAVLAASSKTGAALGDEGFLLARQDGVTVVLAESRPVCCTACSTWCGSASRRSRGDRTAEQHRPALRTRMLDHWDNIDVHPVMGQVERGYSGGSIFWQDGGARGDLTRVRAYARLLAAIRGERGRR